MDSMLGYIDPYIEIDDGYMVSPKAFKYQKAKGVEQTEFNQMFKIPIAWPVSNDKLRIKIKDKDDGSRNDDVLGSIILSYKDIVKNCTGSGTLVWKNLYGSPLGLIQGPIKSYMNNNPEHATLWKGRVLMHVGVRDTKAPEKGVFDLTEPVVPLQQFNQAKSLKKY